MRPTRVLYLITSDLSARFLRGQLDHLVAHGFDVHVAVGRSDHPVPFDEGATVHRIALVRDPSPVRDVRAFVQMVRLIRRLRPDIVNASTPKAGLLGMVASRMLRVPRRVHVVRGFRYETMAGAKRRVMAHLEGLSVRLATDVVFNSRSLMAIAERDGLIAPGRGRILGGGSGNGVDVERFHGRFDRADCRRALDLAPDVPTVGFIGRLTADKGVPELLAAFDQLRANRPDIRLAIVGDYEEGSPVPDQIRRRIADDPAITHRRWSDTPERVYPAFDVVAFPSHREGLPNVVLEAQASGVPVAGFDATGTRDAVSDEARRFLVEIGDAPALARALDELLDDSDVRRDLVERNRRWVADTFAQRRIWDDLIEVYAATG